MLGAGLLGPALDRGALDLDGAPAVATDEVMVVGVGGAQPVARLTLGGAQHVDPVVLGEGRQRAVDGGQTDALPGLTHPLVQVLRGGEVVGLAQLVLDGAALAGAAALGVGHQPTCPGTRRPASPTGSLTGSLPGSLIGSLPGSPAPPIGTIRPERTSCSS